jgi:hypothetical protein
VQRDHPEGAAGHAGVRPVELEQGDEGLAQLLGPAGGIRLRDLELSAHAVHHELVELGPVGHVGVQRGGPGLQRAGDRAHRHRVVPVLAHLGDRHLDDAVGRESLGRRRTPCAARRPVGAAERPGDEVVDALGDLRGQLVPCRH